MRHIIIFILAFVSISSQAQTLTTAKLSDTSRAHNKRLITLNARMDLKDSRDDERNAKIDLLFWENKRLKERLDSAAYYFNYNDFVGDSATRTYSINWGNFINKLRSALLSTPGEAPIMGLTFNELRKNVPLTVNPYTMSTSILIPKDQEIAELKDQIKMFETLLDDDKKIIDKLQKKINKLQKKK